MSAPSVLLINPRMSLPRNARLPLSLLHLAAVLDGRWPWQILDGNFDDDVLGAALRALRERPHALVGITVMPGPQVAPAIALSTAIRQAFPSLPIVWGGYFPTLYPDAALSAPYVDCVVRGQGEGPLLALLEAGSLEPEKLALIGGLSWKRDGVLTHNPDAPILAPATLPPLPYEGLGPVRQWLSPTFLGRRTAAYQAALGCRYRCDFCGVVSMWNGKTVLEAPERLLAAGTRLRERWGADSLQFFDHNFFDREESSVEMLEVLARLELPWWCYARADTLAHFSTASWEKLRASKLRMAYVGAESGSDAALAKMKKGSRVEHTVELVKRCRAYGVIPELSFILGGPDDAEAEVEATFTFIRRLKSLHPEAEVVLYFYSPTPQRARRVPGEGARLPVLQRYGPSGPALPTTPEEWTEPQWVRWVCHQDAPWLTERLRRRIRAFSRVLACRFPTVQDHRTPGWGKAVLRNMARWRYATERYERPWELELAQRFIPLSEPRDQGL